MAEEGFDNHKERTDPDEDYGLPKIEIRPIQKPESKQEKQPATVPVAAAAEEGGNVGPVQSEPAEKASASETESGSTGYSWVAMILVFAAILIGGWFYYDYSSKGERGEEKGEPIVQEQSPEPAPPAEEVVEAPVEEVETFTLTEIKARADRPRYFLVVASFIDEDLARDRAEELQAKEMNTFLVYRYGDIAYYRLAIGQFESFALAAEQIEKEKGNFKENLWVLKY